MKDKSQSADQEAKAERRSKGRIFETQAAVCPVSARLLSVESAAAYLSVSPAQVREWNAKGKLRSTHLPHSSGVGTINRTLFDVIDLDEFIARAKQK